MKAVYEINESLGKVFYQGCFRKENDLLLREIVIRLRGNEPFFIECKRKPKDAFKLYEDEMKKLETEAIEDPGKFIGQIE